MLDKALNFVFADYEVNRMFRRATARAKFKIILNEKFRRNRHFIDENRSGNLLIRIRALARAQMG